LTPIFCCPRTIVKLR